MEIAATSTAALTKSLWLIDMSRPVACCGCRLRRAAVPKPSSPNEVLLNRFLAARFPASRARGEATAMSGRNPNLRRRELNRRERRSRTKRAVDTSTAAATGSPSDAPELLAQLPLGARQYAPTGLREIGARAIDVKNQH